METSVDVDRLRALARSRILPAPVPRPARARSAPARPRIGVARDVAFQFYYPENLELLRTAGAELVFWSPVADREPPDVDALYLGGGYPEVHARALGANRSMREAVKAFAAAGHPVYAECGGLLYLAEALEDETGTIQPMVGLLPAVGRLRATRLTLGYATIETTRETLLGPAGTVVRGHEFHATRLDAVPAWVPRAYAVRDGAGDPPRREGYLIGETLMSYVHLHFGSNPAVADHLVRHARARRGGRAGTPVAVAPPEKGARHE
jgi:cobyrinic acid a,c-diamide synthase